MPARTLQPVQLADPLADLAQLLLGMAPEQLQAWVAILGPEDLALVEQVLAQRTALGWRTDPAAFAHHLDATFRQWAYVRYLSEKFRQAVDGESKRQIWNLPARLGKSLLASQWGPLWALDHTHGRARIILWSYGKALAMENAVGIRDRLALYDGQLTDGCQLAPGRKRMDRFVTQAGGGVLAAGVSGAVRGFGAGAGGGIVADDPFKDWQEAHSEHRRKLVWNQYRGTLLDRLDDEGAWIIHVHHRVHEDDMTGRLLADQARSDGTGDQWDVTVMPALAVAGDVLGREPGEPLEPQRFSKAFTVQLAASMGSYLAAALQQQNPTPEEGTDLLRAWFRLYVTAADPTGPDRYEVLPAAPDQTVTSWDLKLKDREAGDYVVGQAWWRTGPDYWLRDQLRGQWDHATTANAIALLAVRNPECRTHVIESAGAYDEVAPQLRKPQRGYTVTAEMQARLAMTPAEAALVEKLRRRGLAGIVPHPPRGDKRVRARTYIAPAAEAGNVHVPAYGPFTPVLLDEVAAFPDGAHDDQVDAMSQALQRMGTGVATVSAASGRVPKGPVAAGGARGVARPQPANGRGARVSGAQGRLGRPRS